MAPVTGCVLRLGDITGRSMAEQTADADKLNIWDSRFLSLADHISCWSKDPSTKTGAVIVDRDRRIISTGYNGFPRGVTDSHSRLSDRAEKYKFVVHADANAVLTAKGDLSDCTIYVTPLPPCCECTKMIIQAGISRVVCRVFRDSAMETRWAESVAASRIMLAEADVDLLLVR